MTQYTVFTTPGELDLSAIATFGINAKPGTNNPIGFFGTGLKYAIAVLLREDIAFTLHTGGKEYKFYTKDKDFRGKEFKTCRYRKSGILNKFTYHELPFTTELGKHWSLWQAFRELMSNTLDESGGMYVTEELPINNYNPPRTLIIVEGQTFADVANKKDEIFLPLSSMKLVAKTNNIEAYEGRSRYIYYRGMRAYDLKEYEKETLFTYNYTGGLAELTEDRTIKYLFYVKDAIAEMVVRSNDRSFIGTLLKPGDRYFEKGLEFGSIYSKGDTFNSVLSRLAPSKVWGSVTASARAYYSDVIAPTPAAEKPLEVSDEIWTAIEGTLIRLTEDQQDPKYLEALDDIEEEFRTQFNRPKDDGDDIPF